MVAVLPKEGGGFPGPLPDLYAHRSGDGSRGIAQPEFTAPPLILLPIVAWWVPDNSLIWSYTRQRLTQESELVNHREPFYFQSP
jgi:hypothetical protein